eukprot:g1053.t1
MQGRESSRVVRPSARRLSSMDDELLPSATLVLNGFGSVSRTLLLASTTQTGKAKRSRPNMISEDAFTSDGRNKRASGEIRRGNVFGRVDVEPPVSIMESERPAAASGIVVNNNTEETSSQYRQNAIKKAQTEWETHIAAMERVLSENNAQGIPAGPISQEALELLSQMVSKLYELNTSVMYARMQDVMDTHRMNTERIESVFHGLAGVKKAQEVSRGAPSK